MEDSEELFRAIKVKEEKEKFEQTAVDRGDGRPIRLRREKLGRAGLARRAFGDGLGGGSLKRLRTSTVHWENLQNEEKKNNHKVESFQACNCVYSGVEAIAWCGKDYARHPLYWTETAHNEFVPAQAMKKAYLTMKRNCRLFCVSKADTQ
jgi:hypothetical protein